MRGDLRLFSPLILRLFDFVAGFQKSPCSRGSRTGARAAAACLHAGITPLWSPCCGLVRFAAGIEGGLGFV